MDISDKVQSLREKINSSGKEYKYMSLSDRDLRRYIVAHKKVDAAYERIEATNTWRNEFGVANLTDDTPGVTRVKNSTGEKVARLLDARDKLKRPVAYLAARNHSFKNRNLDDWAQYVVFMMEKGCARCLDDGPDNVCVLYDLKGFTLACMDYPLLKVVYSILQDHYPERLGVCCVLNAPTIFTACWAIIRSWLDENTSSKIKFIKNTEELSKYVDPTVIPTDM